MGKIRIRGGRQSGQTLIIFAIAMPLFLSLVALVVDGSTLMVNRRSLQVAADAAALAVAQDLRSTTCTYDPTLAFPIPCLPRVASDYSKKNGGPDGQPCDEIDPGSDPSTKCLPPCNDDPTKTNCYQTPYKSSNALVEVRLTRGVSGLFAGAVGLNRLFHVSARAVASALPVTDENVIPPSVIDPSVSVQTFTGATHTTTDPDTVSGGSGVGFAMSRRCDAITYGGNPNGQVVGAFATNGGLNFNGFGNPKHVFWLAYDQTRCSGFPPSPPSGTNQCTATAWGDATTSNNLCVKTLVNVDQNNTAPVNWPIAPPTPPNPRSGTWNASSDFGVNCINLGSGAVTFTTTGHAPGVYCVNGPAASLTINNVGDLTGGDGYTFFALGGGKIIVAGNTNKVKYYWPSAPPPAGCGARPTTRTATFTCFGRTISGYDPQTLLYATYPSADGTTCAICLQGQTDDLTGDIFAPMPNTFPPTLPPATGGGLVTISGGGLGAGSGFIESWLLSLTGNTGTYTGTGTAIVIPGGTHTTTDPDTFSTTTYPGTTIPGTTQTITTGTTIGMDE